MELKIFLTLLLTAVVSYPFAFVHWVFTLVHASALGAAIYLAFRYIWEVL